MSAGIVDLKAQKDAAVARAEEVVSRAERQKRPLSTVENDLFNKHMAEANSLASEIERVTAKNPRTQIESLKRSAPATAFALPVFGNKNSEPIAPKTLSREYADRYYSDLRAGRISASSTEGGSTSGAPIVPQVTEQETIPFAPASTAIRKRALVVPTTKDVRLAQVTALPTAQAKTEGSGVTPSNSTLASITLTAYTNAIEWDFSREIFDDTLLYSLTALPAAGDALEAIEAQKFLTGSGSGESQGIIGNIDTGVAAATPDTAGNLISVDALYQLVSTLKAKFDPNASFLMAKATSLVIRRAASGGASANLYEPIFRRENGQDLILGYPVDYEDACPSVAAGNTPVIFGDFKAGYLIGDRGGSAIRSVVISQDATKTLLGLVPVVLFRRSHGLVRDPHALKALTLHT